MGKDTRTGSGGEGGELPTVTVKPCSLYTLSEYQCIRVTRVYMCNTYTSIDERHPKQAGCTALFFI